MQKTEHMLKEDYGIWKEERVVNLSIGKTNKKTEYLATVPLIELQILTVGGLALMVLQTSNHYCISTIECC